jgi:DNA-directed RNA polymerase specialized sigma subunit
VYDYAMGEHGKEELRTNMQIATRIGMSESWVRKIKEEILGRLKNI